MSDIAARTAHVDRIMNLANEVAQAHQAHTKAVQAYSLNHAQWETITKASDQITAATATLRAEVSTLVDGYASALDSLGAR